MSVKRCDMCFQDKAGLIPVVPRANAMVCKACGYKVKQVIGFLEYHDCTISYQAKLADQSLPGKEAAITKSKSKISKTDS